MLTGNWYDAPQIHAFSRGLGHVPIIDPHPRGGEKLPLAPAQAQRFKERTSAERVNRRLKERYGGRWVRVRGADKVGEPSGVWAAGADGRGVLCAAVLRSSRRPARRRRP